MRQDVKERATISSHAMSNFKDGTQGRGSRVMDTRELKLRCLIERDGDLWLAYCVDLCLGVQADSAEEVKAKLHGMVIDYLCDVQEAVNQGDRELARQMLGRKAPIEIRLRYQYARLMGWLRRGGKDGRAQRYNERGQVPAVAC